LPVRLRLKRLGRKKKPYYRIVVANSVNPRNGKTIDEIGSYDPTREPAHIELDVEKAKDWLSKGVQPTEPMQRILGDMGVIPKVKRVSKNPGVARKDLKKSEDE